MERYQLQQTTQRFAFSVLCVEKRVTYVRFTGRCCQGVCLNTAACLRKDWITKLYHMIFFPYPLLAPWMPKQPSSCTAPFLTSSLLTRLGLLNNYSWSTQTIFKLVPQGTKSCFPFRKKFQNSVFHRVFKLLLSPLITQDIQLLLESLD